MSERKQKPKLLVATAWLALLVAPLVARLLAPFWWVCELTTHFTPFYALLGILVVGVLATLRCWKQAAAATLLLAYFGWLTAPYVTTWEDGESTSGPTYRVMHLNLLLTNPHWEQVVAQIEQYDPDVLLLQEVTDRWVQDLTMVLRARYPYEILEPRSHAFGIWLLSKHPLHQPQVLPSPQDAGPFLAADVELPTHEGEPRRIHLVGAHPVPPVGANAARLRNQRLAEVGQHLGQCSGPKVVLGDLNCTPWSPYFASLLRAGKLRDTGRWRGWSPTWISRLPWLALPIDHCLVSEEIGVQHREVGSAVGSDHRAICLDLWLRPQ